MATRSCTCSNKFARRFPASRCALRSSSASPARPNRISTNCAISSAPRNSTGWASSRIPTRTTRQELRAATKKSTRKRSRERQNALMEHADRRFRRANCGKRVGQRLQVMLEGPSKDTDLDLGSAARRHGAGNRRQGLHHRIRRRERRRGSSFAGHLATLEVTEAKDYDLIGRVTEIISPARPFTHPGPFRPRIRFRFLPRVNERMHPANFSASRPRVPREITSVLRGMRANFCNASVSEYSWEMKWRCPICRTATDSESSRDFPFCSERCRLIDLGNWASEKYKISEPVIDESVPEETQGRAPQRDTPRRDIDDHED